MKKYHKINSVFKRDKQGKFIMGQFSDPEVEYLKDNLWEFTEKVDGTNIRVGWDGVKICFGGRTDNAQLPGPLVNRLHERFLPQIELFSELFGDANVVLFGEGYGPKIQKGGGNYRDDQDFVLFDILIEDWWLKREDVIELGLGLGLDIVPVIKHGTIDDAIHDAIVGIKSTWGDFESEGYVLRPVVELKARNGNRIITKIKCKDFN